VKHFWMIKEVNLSSKGPRGTGGDTSESPNVWGIFHSITPITEKRRKKEKGKGVVQCLDPLA